MILLQSDYILTTFWLHADYVPTTFWLHSDSFPLFLIIDLKLLLMPGAIFISDDLVFTENADSGNVYEHHVKLA